MTIKAEFTTRGYAPLEIGSVRPPTPFFKVWTHSLIKVKKKILKIKKDRNHEEKPSEKTKQKKNFQREAAKSKLGAKRFRAIFLNLGASKS